MFESIPFSNSIVANCGHLIESNNNINLNVYFQTPSVKPTKYHFYPHNQHIYLLPECAIQQVRDPIQLMSPISNVLQVFVDTAVAAVAADVRLEFIDFFLCKLKLCMCLCV